ncbi:2'-5' RNA ligase family protein [Simkania sp.]|uniref:2'-5' RNA ligase family protein n=1 Tax=Simkania sp. TaxID=34094 RepID=UPI003B524F4F
MNATDEKRLFFGFEVRCPWPEGFPKARLLDPAHRHLTVAFLGKTSMEKVQNLLPDMPKPPMVLGRVAVFDKCLFLPPKAARVVAYHPQFATEDDPLFAYQKTLTAFLETHGYTFEKRRFLPHVTMGRRPFDREEWENFFAPLPLFYSSLHLYESLGNSQYKSIWSLPLKLPFIEIEHVADIAFHVFGQTEEEVHLNAQMALCFECPSLLKFVQFEKLYNRIEEIVIQLNEMVTKGDQSEGTPFKAVSFHGEMERTKDGLYMWEMIVDV